MKIRQWTGTGEWTTRRYLSLLGTVLIWAIVAIDAWYLWPSQLGGATSMVIVSGRSMEPTFFGGDLVIARNMDPSVGDVIIYAPEGLGGSQIVHRIIGGNAEDGWRMQGDNNDFVDPFTPKGDEVKGVVLVHYSNFGRISALLLNPMIWAFILLAALVLLLWWSDDCDDDDQSNDSDSAGDDQAEAEDEEEPDLIDRVVEGTEAAVARMVAASTAAMVGVWSALTRPSQGPRHAAAPQHAFSSPRRPAVAFLRIGAVFAVVGVISVLGVTSASASQLNVSATGGVFADSLTKCASQSLTASATGPSSGNQYSQVTVSGIASACAGLPMSVTVHRANGNVLTTGSGTAATGSAAIAVASFNVVQADTVFVQINGWIFPAAWVSPPQTFPAPGQCDGVLMSTGQLVTAASCSLTVTTQSVNYGGFLWFYLSVSASTSFNPSGYLLPNGSWVNYQDVTLWRYTVDLESLPSAGWMGNLDDQFYLYKNGNNTVLATGEDCSTPHDVTFQEETPGGNPSSNFIVSPQAISWMAPSSLLCQGP